MQSGTHTPWGHDAVLDWPPIILGNRYTYRVFIDDDVIYNEWQGGAKYFLFP